MESEARLLLKAASRPYLDAGLHPYFFARGKLAIDPIFLALLRTGAIPDGARILDLGCGQALLAALLVAARTQYEQGTWPDGWPPPPAPAELHGIDIDSRSTAWARKALGNRVSVQTADLRTALLPDADVVLLLDVLHYLDEPEQLALMDKVAHALRGGGRLLLRVADAESGWRFRLTRMVDHSTLWMRGRVTAGFFCRTIAEWSELLMRHGFRIERQPMSQGTPFANVLLTAFRQP